MNRTILILTASICLASIQDGLNYVDRFVSSQEIWREAFSEAVRNNRIIVSNDQTLVQICQEAHVRVVC